MSYEPEFVDPGGFEPAVLPVRGGDSPVELEARIFATPEPSLVEPKRGLMGIVDFPTLGPRLGPEAPFEDSTPTSSLGGNDPLLYVPVEVEDPLGRPTLRKGP